MYCVKDRLNCQTQKFTSAYECLQIAYSYQPLLNCSVFRHVRISDQSYIQKKKPDVKKLGLSKLAR